MHVQKHARMGMCNVRMPPHLSRCTWHSTMVSRLSVCVVWGHPCSFMRTGLYRLCQYPNYTGEIGLWTAAWVLANAPRLWPHLWWTCASPALTAYLLVYVSGVCGCSIDVLQV